MQQTAADNLGHGCLCSEINFPCLERSIGFNLDFHSYWDTSEFAFVVCGSQVFPTNSWFCESFSGSLIREVVKKSKWKFKMAFAMKGGGLEGVSSATYLFWKMIFVKNHFESFPDCENVFCLWHAVGWSWTRIIGHLSIGRKTLQTYSQIWIFMIYRFPVSLLASSSFGGFRGAMKI